MTRRKELGNLGEKWTVRLLQRARFRDIQDLNERRYNHPGADFLADRDGIRYFITVKARNKYRQGTRSLNGGYNIHPNKVLKFAQQYDAEPAWLTIQVDTESRCFSAYFGTIASLRNPSGVGVPMTPNAVAGYECLARDQFDAQIIPDLSNQIDEIATVPLKTFKPPRRAAKAMETPVSVSFNDHYNYTDEERRHLLIKIRQAVRGLDDNIFEKVTPAQRVAYNKPNRKIFLEVKVQKHAIMLHMITVPDPDQVLSTIPGSHEWDQLARRVKIETDSDLDRVLPLIRIAYQRG